MSDNKQPVNYAAAHLCHPQSTQKERPGHLSEHDVISVHEVDFVHLDHIDRSRPARSKHRASGSFSPPKQPATVASLKQARRAGEPGIAELNPEKFGAEATPLIR